MEVRIADDGEILVKGNNVFKGYFNDPEATAQTLKDGWLMSGDVGELDEEGFLRITDRKKDLFITAGGKNIAPQYIENKLKFSPYINDAVVIGDGRRYITALIVIDEENVGNWAQTEKIPYTTYTDLTQNEQVRELIAAEVAKVNKTLANPEQVKRFAILPTRLHQEDGDVTPTLKVKRQAVMERFADLVAALYSGQDVVSQETEESRASETRPARVEPTAASLRRGMSTLPLSARPWTKFYPEGVPESLEYPGGVAGACRCCGQPAPIRNGPP